MLQLKSLSVLDIFLQMLQELKKHIREAAHAHFFQRNRDKHIKVMAIRLAIAIKNITRHILGFVCVK